MFCQRAGGQGSSSSASGRGAGRAHRDVRLERNQDFNSKMQEQLLPKRESCCVWGEEWSLGLCSCTCSLCSPGWFLLQQSSLRSMPMYILGGGFHVGTSELSCPHGRPGSPAGLCSMFPLSAGSTSSWLSLWPLSLLAGCSRTTSAQAALAACSSG